LLTRARQEVDRRVAGTEAEVKILAVRIAERILRRELELRPEVIADVAKAALADARGRHDFVLRVHPDDVAVLEADKPGLLARLSVSAHILIRADDSIDRGGCVVESEVGVVDARLTTQLAAIERALLESE